MGLLLLAVVLLAGGPVVLFGSAYVYSRLQESEWRDRLWIVGSGVALGSGWYRWIWPHVQGLTETLLASLQHGLQWGSWEYESMLVLGAVWVLSIPLIPIGGVVMGALDKLWEVFLKPKTLDEQLKAEQQKLEWHEQRLSKRARRAEQTPPAPMAGLLQLGPEVRGDQFPPEMGVHRVKRWLALEERLLDEHLFVLGTTGAGKTETLKRLVYEVLHRTGRDVFLVDGKGEEQLAADIRAMTFDAGRGAAPIFRMGGTKRGAVYDGFRGAPQDIYNRLAAMIGVAEAEGDAQYYADINRDLLQLVCYAPEGPPRRFEDVRERLDLTWLKQAWQHDPIESKTVLTLTDRELDGLRRRLRPLAREFAPLVGPEGFALEETGCAIFSIRTQSVSDTAARFLRFLIEDLKDFTGKRQVRPGLLIIDEFGAFGNDNVIALLTQARSAQMGVILATQDLATLGDQLTTQKILSCTRTKLLMVSDFAEEMAKLAGTKYQAESSIQHEEGAPTGMGSVRIQHAFKIDPNEVASLRPGEGFLIRQRRQAKLRTALVEEIPPVPDEELQEHHPDAPAKTDDQAGDDPPVIRLF